MNQAVFDPIENLHRQFLRMTDALSAFRELAELRPDIEHGLEETLRTAMAILLQHGDFAACSVFLREDDGLLRCRAGAIRQAGPEAASAETAAPHAFAPNEGVAGRVVVSGRPWHCRDTRFDKHFVALPGRPIRSLLCLPLRDRDETLGVLNASHPEPHAFDDHQERFLEVSAALLTRLIHLHRCLSRPHAAGREAEIPALEARIRDLEKQLRQTALRDPVTGLPNDRFFAGELHRLAAGAERAGTPLALLLVQLAAPQGHAAALDSRQRHLLWSLAAGLLRTQARTGDLLCHLGRGRFAIALVAGTLQSARRLAERIRADLAALRYRAGDREWCLEAAFGMAEAQPAGATDASPGARLDVNMLMEEALASLQAEEERWQE